VSIRGNLHLAALLILAGGNGEAKWRFFANMQTREEKTKAVGPKLLVFTVEFYKDLLYQNSQKFVHLAAVLILEDGDDEAKWRFLRICKRERKKQKL
jgi:hypothetical protein